MAGLQAVELDQARPGQAGRGLQGCRHLKQQPAESPRQLPLAASLPWAMVLSPPIRKRAVHTIREVGAAVGCVTISMHAGHPA